MFDNAKNAKRHDDIVTPQLPRYNKLDSSSSENTSAEIRPRFVRARGIFGWSRWRCWKDYRQQPTTQEEKQNLSVLKQELILS